LASLAARESTLQVTRDVNASGMALNLGDMPQTVHRCIEVQPAVNIALTEDCAMSGQCQIVVSPQSEKDKQMPAPLLSTYFTLQRPCCHSLEAGLVLLITDIGNNPLAGAVVKVNVRSSVHLKVQSADINAPKTDVRERKTGNADEWSVYYCLSSTALTYVILMVGKVPLGKPVLPFFDWIMSAEDDVALKGNWAIGERNADVDLTYTGALKYAHADKHFKPANVSDAQYTIGALLTRKNIVAGMEEKAVTDGFGSGERFFQFSSNVGKDPTDNTGCIRVDSPGEATQHSHPIPQSGTGKVTHDTKVGTTIAYHTREQQLAELVKLAKYLTVINSRAKEFKVPKLLCGDNKPPPCKYWVLG
jgi:hypothetical protein